MKLQSKYICQQCGYVSGGWMGKCPECNTWGSLVESVEEVGSKGLGRGIRGRREKGKEAIKPVRLSEVKVVVTDRLRTGVEEFDRVMGGGIIPGSVILIAGEPGVGKSTLLSSVLNNFSVLYVSGEESATQVKARVERLGIKNEKLWLLNETNVGRVIGEIREMRKPASVPTKSGLRRGEARSLPSQSGLRRGEEENIPEIVVIDSIQTMWTEELNGSAGSVGQVRECANKLLEIGKLENIPIFLIGHVTKEGVIAGPKILEHLVDTVLYLEGERFQSLRLLRSTKNRFGPTDEVGVFKMEGGGMKEVKNPSEMFIGPASVPTQSGLRRGERKIGSVVTVAMEGTRPILAEIQALVVSTQIPVPRRVVSGLDYNRVQLIIAVLQKYLHLPLYSSDIYVSVSGGLKILEPAADLAVALAIWSSFKNKALPRDLATYGEISLLGEIRPVGNSERREKEAKRLGFKKILTGDNLIETINRFH